MDVKIAFTGLREGEKMYEELLMDEESTLPTDNQSIMVSTGQDIGYDEVAAKLKELEAALEDRRQSGGHSGGRRAHVPPHSQQVRGSPNSPRAGFRSPFPSSLLQPGFVRCVFVSPLVKRFELS